METDYASIDKVYQSSINRSIIEDFMFKKGKGRHRVFDRVNKNLCRHGARLEVSRLDGKKPVALWSVLKCRDAVLAEPDHPRDEQDCVCVNYVFIGWSQETPKGGAGEGLWSMEFTWHSLGRYLERSSGSDLSKAILAAHDAVLKVDIREVKKKRMGPNQTKFTLHVGNDIWKCEFRFGYEVSMDEGLHIHVVARTHLDFNQLNPDQEVGLILPLTQVNGFSLGESWLTPAPFRDLERHGKKVSMKIAPEWRSLTQTIKRS